MHRKFLFCLLSITATTLFAEEDSYSFWDYHPWRMGGQAIRFGKAEVSGSEGGHLSFRKTNAFTSMLVPITRHHILIPRVEYNLYTMDWNKNPKFDDTHFYYMQFSLGYMNTALEKWRWIFRFDYNIDVEHFSNPNPYSLYNFLGWGSYQIHRKWHYHLGILGYKGMEGEMVYPIIGLDFKPNKNWFFQAIFPMTYSAEYLLDPYWRFAFKVRPMKERLRAGNNEPQPRSVLSYSTTGAELNVHFQYTRWVELEIYGGYNFGGKFYIKDRNGHHAIYTDLGGSPYAGLALEWGF